MATDRSGPLADVTVLEVANWVAAPTAGALMADMGADVVKVEPLSGDGMRMKLRQPKWPEGAPKTDIPFQLDNRGKRSIAVDLTDERGAALVRELAGQADVFLTNLLPNRLARFGLGPDQLRAADARLVYAVVSGFGPEGPAADRIGFDVTAFFAQGGIMGLVGEPDAPPPAFRPGQGDHPTGLALLVGILAALRERDRTGEGQVVETALLRSAAWSIGCDVSVALVDRHHPEKKDRADVFSPLNARYRCGDGRWLNLSAQDQNRWLAFCREAGLDDLADDERFATPAGRYQHRFELVAALDARFESMDSDEAGAVLDRAGVAWARVATLTELVDDEQVRANDWLATVDHPVIGEFETLAAPFSLSGGGAYVRGPAPETGADTTAVLRQFGIAEDRIAALSAAGVVGQGM